MWFFHRSYWLVAIGLSQKCKLPSEERARRIASEVLLGLAGTARSEPAARVRGWKRESSTDRARGLRNECQWAAVARRRDYGRSVQRTGEVGNGKRRRPKRVEALSQWDEADGELLNRKEKEGGRERSQAAVRTRPWRWPREKWRPWQGKDPGPIHP